MPRVQSARPPLQLECIQRRQSSCFGRRGTAYQHPHGTLVGHVCTGLAKLGHRRPPARGDQAATQRRVPCWASGSIVCCLFGAGPAGLSSGASPGSQACLFFEFLVQLSGASSGPHSLLPLEYQIPLEDYLLRELLMQHLCQATLQNWLKTN